MKGDTEVIILVLAFFAGFATHALAMDSISASVALGFVAPAATLIAAYVGAKFAFLYQDKLRSDRTINDQVAAANLAIFELSRISNTFKLIDQQYLAEHRSDPVRHLHILPAAAGTWEAPKFDFPALAFLFRSSDANALGRLSAFEREVASIYECIDLRSKLYVEELQTAVERAHEKFGDPLTPAQIEIELGPRHTEHLKLYTVFVVEGVSNVLAGSEQLASEIFALSRELLPGQPIIKFSAPEG